MNPDMRGRLRLLGESQGQEYGKLVQKLLAVAFLETGADRVTERSIQGIDLEVEVLGRRLAIEVKTTVGASVKIGVKDADGLAARAKDRYETLIAVLGSRFIDEWVFARWTDGEPQANVPLPLVVFRAYRDSELEQLVSGPFGAALATHANGAAERGQTYLNEILRAYPKFDPA